MLAINRARSLSERTGEPKSDIRPTPNGDCRRRGRGENISRVKLRGKEWGGRSPQAIENCGSESERRSLQRLPLAFDVFSAHVPEADFWPGITSALLVIRQEGARRARVTEFASRERKSLLCRRRAILAGSHPGPSLSKMRRGIRFGGRPSGWHPLPLFHQLFVCAARRAPLRDASNKRNVHPRTNSWTRNTHHSPIPSISAS